MSNEAVAAYRQLHPDDQRGDDDLTTYLAIASPDTFNTYPDAVKDYDRIQTDLQRSLLGPGDYVKQAAGEAIRGVTRTAADLPKALGTAAVMLADKTGVRLGEPETPQETGLYKLGEGIEALGDKISPDPVPVLQDSLWASKLPNTVGSIVGFMAGGGIAKGLAQGSIKLVAKAAFDDALKEGVEIGLAKAAAEKAATAAANKVHLLAAGTLGAAASGVSAYQDAISRGASQADAENAFLANLPVGATYGLPVAELLTPGSTRLGKIARDLGVGVGTMDAQQIVSNLIAKKLYDPNRNIAEGLAETTTTGGIATAALSALSHKLMGKSVAAKPTDINPMMNYEPDAETQAKVAELVRRQAAGEISPAIDVRATLNPIEANIYDQLRHSARATFTGSNGRLGTEMPAETGKDTAGTPIPAAESLTTTSAAAVPPASDRNPAGGVVTTPTPTPNAATGILLNAIRAKSVTAPEEAAPILPDLSKKRAAVLATKPIHELTPDEFVQVASKKMQDMGRPVPPEADLLAAHQFAVEKAMKDGDEIPGRVLEAYPDLEKQVAAASQEPLQAAIALPTSINSPNPENAELINPHGAGLLNMVDFAKAKVVSGEKGLGQKNAPAFLATSDPEELYKNVRANERNKNLTRRVGVFESPDGTIQTGPVYENRGQRVALPSGTGKTQSMLYSAAVAKGYKLVAALKVKEAVHSSSASVAVTYSPKQWKRIEAELKARSEAAKGTAAAMEQHLTGITMPVAPEAGQYGEIGHVPDTELPAKHGKAKPPETVSDEEIRRLSKLVEVEPFNAGHAALLWDEIGAGPIDAESALLTLDSLRADPHDGPRVAALSLILKFEERYPNEKPEEIIALAAETLSRAAGKATSESDFALRLGKEGAGADSSKPAAEAAGARAGAAKPGKSNAGADTATVRAGAEPGSGEQSAATPPADDSELTDAEYAAEQVSVNESDVRFSERPASSTLSNGDILGRFNDVLESAQARGLDVSVLKAAMGDKERGVYSPGAVILSLHDPLTPTHDNLVLLMHEIGHDVFNLLHLNPKMTDAFHRAIDKLSTPEGFTAKIGEGVTAKHVMAEETLVERAARNLLAEGFNPKQAQSIAQRLYRFIQRMYQRATMAIQASFMGADHVNPELAEAYFENRMRSFLAGDLQPMSILSFFGGSKLTPEQRGDTFQHGANLGAQFNSDAGQMEYREALPSTVEAMKFNQRIAQEAVRYSERTPLSDVKTTDEHVISADHNSPAKVEEDVAAYNVLNDIHQAAFRVFQKAGLAKPGYMFEQFLNDFTNADTPTTAKIDARNNDLAANKLPPVDPRLRPHDLLNESSQMMASDKALRFGYELRTHWNERRARSDSFLSTADERLNRQNVQLADILKRYTDMDVQLLFAKSKVGELLSQVRDDFRLGTNAAHKDGILTQVIRSIDGKKPDTAMVKALDSVYRRLSGDKDHKFTEMLQKVADIGVDWKNVSAKEGLEFVKDIIAHTDPDLEPLQKRALASIAVAYAKTNEHAMGLMELARSSAVEERAKVTEILRKAVEGNAEAIPQARKLAKSLPRLGRLTDRLLTKLEELKAENRQHIDEMQRSRAFVELHDQAAPVLADHLRQLERTIGAKSPSWEPNDGATYHLALKPDAQEGHVLANEQALKLDGAAGNSKLSQHITQNQAWLDAQPEGKRGAAWNTINEQTQKLKQVVSLAQHERVIKPSAINNWLGSLSDKLNSLGIPSLVNSGTRQRRYLSNRDSNATMADNFGNKWAAAESRAMKALGVAGDNTTAFRRVIYDPVLDFANKHPEVLALHKDSRAAWEALLPQIKDFLMRNPDLRARLKDPEAWKHVETYIRQTYLNVAEMMKLHKTLNLKIQETMSDGTVIEREPIGAPGFTVPQQVCNHVLRMYQGMRDAGWLGTGESGKLNAADISEAYAKDPDALSQEVATRINADIWREFVSPLATGMEGRSAFYGPKQADGIERVAGVANVAKAFNASGGDMVKFAEALFDLESDGKDVTESPADFVGKTLAGFQGFFDNLHGQFKDYDTALRKGVPLPPRFLMDARTSESYPGAWLEHMPMGHQDMQVMVSRLAAEAAYGRNHEGMERDMQNGINNLKEKADKFEHVTNLVRTSNLFATGKALDAAIKKAVESDAEARDKGWSYQALRQARENLPLASKCRTEWQNMMKLDGGVALELRPWLESVGAIAGLTVQGPSTAFLHGTTFIQTFSKLGLSPMALKVMGHSASSATSEFMGGLARLVGQDIQWNAERNARRKRIGYVEPDSQRKFSDALTGLLRDPANTTNPVNRLVFKVARAARLSVSTGFGKTPEGSETAYPTVKPHAPFTWTAQLFDAGSIDGWVHGFEDAIERAVEHFKSNPGDRTNKDFAFTKLTDLNYSRGFLGIGSEEKAFRFFKDSLARYGMDLEGVARDVLDRRDRGENAAPITDEQFRALAGVVRNEVSLDSQGSRPTALTTNPLLRFASPLLGWPLAKAHDTWEAFRNPDMTLTNENKVKAFYAGMLPYLALVPASIGLAYLKDQFNADVVGKKANREDPFTSFKGMLDALAWTGTLGGIEGDMLNAYVNGDTQRPFDVDHRVFFISSLHGLWNAARGWQAQGSVLPDYATVQRPMLQALGGSGYLQYADIINHALALDNTEARVTARINATNYLRVAGRELKMDVRVSDGGTVLSNPLRPLIGQMAMAAYANNSQDFREAYRSALDEAVKEKREQAKTPLQRQRIMQDAKDAVQRAYAGRSPLRTVFATEPTEQEYQRLLGSLDDNGRAAVADAMRLFNHYGTQVESSKGAGLTPSTGRKSPMRMGTPFSLDRVRQLSVGMPTEPTANLDRVRQLSVGT